MKLESEGNRTVFGGKMTKEMEKYRREIVGKRLSVLRRNAEAGKAGDASAANSPLKEGHTWE